MSMPVHRYETAEGIRWHWADMQLIFDFPLANVGSAMFEGLNSFALLAAPCSS